MKLLYQNWGASSWSVDFIQHELLDHINNLEIEFFTQDNVKLLLDRSELINNTILVISCTSLDYDIALQLIERIRPIILFQLSDEHGNKNHWNILAKYTHLLLREYNINWYNYHNNSVQIPLGYATGFLQQKKSSAIIPKKMIDRSFNCSFIGKVKQDREYMINIFQKNMDKTYFKDVHNDWDVSKQYYSPSEVYNIYNDSIFVINGRGYHTLDCYRIYETIVAGAIPVIVGEESEINNTFNYKNNVIPFIYCKTWDEAVNKCNNLINDYEKLQKLQDNLLLWWREQLSSIKENINNILNVYKMTYQQLQTHIETAFNNAENGISKITKDIINMEGMTGIKTRHFYNNLLNLEDARYLEIGTWKGSSVCSAMCGNKAKVICIDNWSEFGGPKNEFLLNFNKYMGENNADFIEQDCYKVDISKLSKFNIYMYDGNHTKDSHYNALVHYYNCLDDIFVFIVDDWNWHDVREGTLESFNQLKLSILYQKEIYTPGNCTLDTWWNGIYVAILKKC